VVEAVEDDHLVETTFLAEPSQECEVACGNPTIAAKELCRSRKGRPELFEIKRSVLEEPLHGLVHFFVRHSKATARASISAIRV
jgi:hypothetical protein